MSDSASVTASSLTISENRPRRTGGCVGIFFQLFDWNRRFAKKKLFSKRLLPPDRAKETSKKFGGDDKLPKLRLIADENSGGFPNTNKNSVSTITTAGKNGAQPPSLVARLMGLESMPSVNRDKHHKSASNKGEFEKETTRQDFRPQKLQKTETTDRRNVTRFGAEALQLKNVLSRSRKHHHPKLTSPVKTTPNRKNTSRLIGAAASRILEPKRKSNSKYALLTYPHSSRTNRLKGENLEPSNHPSCKNCGNILHITETTSVNQFQNGNLRFNQEEEFFTNNRRLSCFPSGTDAVSDVKDFVALNKSNLSGRIKSRVPIKEQELSTNYLSQGQKRHLPRVRKEEGGFGVKQMRGECEGQNGEMFRFSSLPMKNRCEVSRKVEKRRDQNGNLKSNLSKKLAMNPIDKRVCLQKPFPLSGDLSGVNFDGKLNEMKSRIEYESGINGGIKRTSSQIFQELICALNKERTFSQNEMEFNPQSFCLQRNSEKSGALIGYKNSNHLSPGSVLDTNFSNDSCCSSSLEDSSGRMQNDSMTYSNDSSQFQDYSEPNIFYSSSEIVDTLTETMWTKFGNFFGYETPKTRYQLKRFVFDCFIEYLDSKYGENTESGFKAWMGSRVLIDEVMEEVMRWMDLIGLDAGEVAERDLRGSLGKVVDFEGEVCEIGGRIEGELFKMLVDEIVVDLIVRI